MKTLSHRDQTDWKRMFAIGSLAGVSALFAGCEAGPNEKAGTAAGAATGAVIGGIIGHQSDEGNKGAIIGAAAGAAIGNEIGEERDEQTRPYEDDDVADIDYGDLMTTAEKDRVRARAGERIIVDWGDYLTPEEKRRLVDRANGGVGG